MRCCRRSTTNCGDSRRTNCVAIVATTRCSRPRWCTMCSCACSVPPRWPPVPAAGPRGGARGAGDLDRALAELGELDERMATMVELRYFVGLEVGEVASLMEIDERTVYRDWAMARAWLKQRLA